MLEELVLRQKDHGEHPDRGKRSRCRRS